ncbi:hypothetical protein L208DRAFT_1029460, partial [Tricholoma matsutake]
WVCTCTQFIVNHFLICKHLVQAVHPVHPVLFLEELQLQCLVPPPRAWICSYVASPENDIDGSNGSDDELIDTSLNTRQDGRATYHKTMKAHVNTIQDICDGLEYQIQFEDQQFLDTLEREGAHFLRLMENCLSRERHSNSMRSAAPAT